MDSSVSPASGRVRWRPPTRSSGPRSQSPEVVIGHKRSKKVNERVIRGQRRLNERVIRGRHIYYRLANRVRYDYLNVKTTFASVLLNSKWS